MSHFLTNKDGRQPLRPEVIKALLPTASEMPTVGGKKEEKKADAPKKEEKKGDAPKKEEHKEDAPKTEDKKDDAPKAEAKKADATKNAPAPAASPAANDSKPAEAAQENSRMFYYVHGRIIGSNFSSSFEASLIICNDFGHHCCIQTLFRA